MVHRHGLVPVLLQVVGGSLNRDLRIQVTLGLLLGFCLLVLELGVAVLIHGVAVVLLHEKCYTWVLEACNGTFRAYFKGTSWSKVRYGYESND